MLKKFVYFFFGNFIVNQGINGFSSGGSNYGANSNSRQGVITLSNINIDSSDNASLTVSNNLVLGDNSQIIFLSTQNYSVTSTAIIPSVSSITPGQFIVTLFNTGPGNYGPANYSVAFLIL